MLLEQELDDGIHSVVVSGPIGASEADAVLSAVDVALAQEPRGVVIDLTGATEMTRDALAGLCSLSSRRADWPRAAITFCSSSAEVTSALAGMGVHADRAEALRHIDDRPDAPLVERVDLQHSFDSPARARAAVDACTERLGLQEIRDDVALVVTEMVTNAIRHAQPPVTVEIQAQADAVLIAVRDGSPERPRPRPAGADAEGGRGLLLVDLLAAEHGIRPDPPGKTVWAALTRRRSAPP